MGYGLLSSGDEANIDRAIETFSYNVEIYPESAKVYDSLAEAYAARGDTHQAIQNHEKALSMEPKIIFAVAQLDRLRMRQQYYMPDQSAISIYDMARNTRRQQGLSEGFTESSPSRGPDKTRSGPSASGSAVDGGAQHRNAERAAVIFARIVESSGPKFPCTHGHLAAIGTEPMTAGWPRSIRFFPIIVDKPVKSPPQIFGILRLP